MNWSLTFPNNINQLFCDTEAPFMWLNLDALDYNIYQIYQKTKSSKVRIASKSIRSLDALHYIIHNQENICGIMAYSAREAIFLMQNGCMDILLGYPTLEKNAIIEAQKMADKTGAKLTFMCDLPIHFQLLEEIGKTLDTKISCCIDIDVSVQFPGLYFGVFRSHLRKPEDLEKLLSSIDTFRHIKIWGLMGYEAQIAGVPDNNPSEKIKNYIIRFLKKRSLPILAARRAKMYEILKKYCGHDIEVNGGGTGSIEQTLKEKYITEVTVGSGYFQSHIFDQFLSIQHRAAVGFALRVTRNPAPDVYTCQSGGFIASGPVSTVKQPVIYYPANAVWLKNEGFGEVQTPFKISPKNSIKVGDLLVLRHAKAGELSEHFSEIKLIKNNLYHASWKSYRGANQEFH